MIIIGKEGKFCCKPNGMDPIHQLKKMCLPDIKFIFLSSRFINLVRHLQHRSVIKYSFKILVLIISH